MLRKNILEGLPPPCLFLNKRIVIEEGENN